MNHSSVRALAPGKAILSGEHSIVYGAPALAIAVGQYARVELTSLESQRHEVILNLTDLGYQQKKTIDEISTLKKELDLDFENQRVSPAAQVDFIQEPGTLYFYAIALFMERFSSGPQAFSVQMVSDIPVGAGMGSSAATLAALFVALHEFFCVPVEKKALIEMTAYAERLQHFCVSRIDSHVVNTGGLVHFDNDGVTSVKGDLPGSWYLIHTGKPESTTGECVRYVRKRFVKSGIWSEFSEVTRDFEKAICCQNMSVISQSLRHNQRLLFEIGVVPEKINTFCRDLHDSCGIMAKTSGAGSIFGNNAGLLVAFGEDDLHESTRFHEICHKNGFHYQLLVCDDAGARLL